MIKGNEALLGTSYDYCFRLLLEYSKEKNIDEVLYKSIGYNFENNKEQLIIDFNRESKINLYNALIKLSIKLSINENKYRTGRQIEYYMYKENTITELEKELKRLLRISLPKLQKARESNIIYNPNFAIEGILADGDMIIDDILIDFKVTSKLNINQYINQLVGYKILNDINHTYNINKIALYYPRFNYYPIFNLDHIIKDSERLKRLFEFKY